MAARATRPIPIGRTGCSAEPGRGTIARSFTAENDYLIDREKQRNVSFSGIDDFVSQDLMVTESMGAIFDRTNERLGTTDVPIIRMRRILIDAAKGLAQGQQPPALAGVEGHDLRDIRAVEKILEPGENWQVLGTWDDPTVQESMAALQAD